MLTYSSLTEEHKFLHLLVHAFDETVFVVEVEHERRPSRHWRNVVEPSVTIWLKHVWANFQLR